MTPGERQTIEATLRKLLDSGPFKASPRMARFLTFVVEHTLSENPEPLKEYAVPTEKSVPGAIVDVTADRG